jgi:hypothetical protein
MLTRKSLVLSAQALCISTAVIIAPAALATPASAAALPVACSETALQTAITTANGTPGSDTLDLAPGCAYRLTGELPAITSPMVVNGNGDTITRISGTFRILTVEGGRLTLQTTIITKGDATGSSVQPGAGGGIAVTGNGTLTVNASVIRSNHADSGGGISVQAGSQAQVNSSTLTVNTAAQNGGGIDSAGAVTVTASQVGENTAGGAGGGIASVRTLTVVASSILTNTAANGGGLANGVPSAAGGTATLITSNISNNTASGTNPGGVYNNGGTVNLRVTRVGANVPNNSLNSPTAVPGSTG